MKHYAGLDVSVKETSICIVDETGKVCRELKVASHPEDLLRVLQDPAWNLVRVGLEAGPLSQWLFNGLAEAGIPALCIETVGGSDDGSQRRPPCRSGSAANWQGGSQAGGAKALPSGRRRRSCRGQLDGRYLADIDANDGNLGAGFGGFALRWHGRFLCSGYPPLQVGGNRRSIPLAVDFAMRP